MNKELHALGKAFMDRAGQKCKFPKLAAYVNGAKVVAVGDLVRLCLEMKTALMDIRAKATFELDLPTDLERTCLSIIKKRADEVLK